MLWGRGNWKILGLRMIISKVVVVGGFGSGGFFEYATTCNTLSVRKIILDALR